MIVRIYTGNDGQTHFEDLPLPAEEIHNVAIQAGADLVFRCFPAVSGDLKLHQYWRFENGHFLLEIQREKMAFSSVFFVSRAMARSCESLRRDPQQI
jgi:hypothetical protein